MKPEVHLGSKIVRPASFAGVAAVKVFNDSGQLLAIAMEQGPGVVVATADDPAFEGFCAQYGINAKAADDLHRHKQRLDHPRAGLVTA